MANHSAGPSVESMISARKRGASIGGALGGWIFSGVAKGLADSATHGAHPGSVGIGMIAGEVGSRIGSAIGGPTGIVIGSTGHAINNVVQKIVPAEKQQQIVQGTRGRMKEVKKRAVSATKKIGRSS